MSSRTSTVCFVARPDFVSKPGGDTVQWRLYAEAARTAGWRTIEWFAEERMPEADFFHAFDIDKPFFIYPKLRRVCRAGGRYVLSTIHHPYPWVEAFRRRNPPGGSAGRVLYRSPLGNSVARAETMKEILRVLQARNPRTLAWLWPSWRRRVRWLLDHAAQVWLLSHAEGVAVRSEIGAIEPQDRAVVVPNWVAGIDVSGEHVRNGTEPDAEGAVLLVGRVEARKNTLGTARLLDQAGEKVLVVGRSNPNEGAYARELEQLVRESRNVRWLPGVERQRMAAIYRAGRCLLNASFAEVSPMVDIEAFACGCPVITTRFALHHEILPPDTPVVDPTASESILQAVRQVNTAARRPPTDVVDPTQASRMVGDLYEKLLS